jgi:hypothetical protein
MKLIQARIRGLGPLTESRWFDLNPHLNLLRFPEQKYGRNFLRILQTINPTYAIDTVKPFADFPKYTKKDGHTRRVDPAKRTVALAVFSATPHLVKELAVLNQWLYETDRIEVGRRLDYSRWINFVELASSTRWSEISDSVQTLLNEAHRLAPDRITPLSDIIRNLKPEDRVKGKLQDLLKRWLHDLPPRLRESSRELIETTHTAVLRADHFHTAGEIVRTRLPLFIIIGGHSVDAQQNPSDKGQDSASPHHLLYLTSQKIDALNRKSNNDGREFLKALNEQLAAFHYPGIMLRLDKPSTGVLQVLNDTPNRLSTTGPLTAFRQIQTKACLAVAFSRVACKTEPILLFDGPEQVLPSTLHRELADFVIDISNTCQCLYSFDEIDIFPNDITGRRYSAAELETTKEQKNE